MMDWSPASILAALLYTWGLGLAPALIARRFTKKPLENFQANGLAFVTCTTLALFALVLKVDAGEPNARISPAWVMVFIVSRWIMVRQGKQHVVLGTTASELQPRLSRSEITTKLRQMIADPVTPAGERVWAEERLRGYEQLSSDTVGKTKRISIRMWISQQRFGFPVIARHLAVSVAVLIGLDLLLMASGQRLLVREKIVHPGEHFVTDEWDFGGVTKPVVVCWYWSGRRVVSAPAWYGVGTKQIDECPFLTDPESKVWAG